MHLFPSLLTGRTLSALVALAFLSGGSLWAKVDDPTATTSEVMEETTEVTEIDSAAVSVDPIAAEAEAFLPDNPVLMIAIGDRAAMESRFSESPLVELWQNPDVQKLLEPILEADGGFLENLESYRVETHEELETDDEELAELFPGRIWGFIPTPPEGFEFGDGYAILIEHNGDKDRLVEMMYTSAEFDSENLETGDHYIEEEEVLGLRLFYEYIEDDETGDEEFAGGYALSDHWVVLVDQKEQLQAMAERAEGTRTDALARNATYLEALASIPERDVFLFLDPAFLNEIMDEVAANQEGDPAQKQMVQALIQNMKLEEFSYWGAGVAFLEEGADLTSALSLSGTEGIAGIFNAYGPEAAPPLLIAPPDALTVSSVQMDFSQFLAKIEDIMARSMPMPIGMFRGMLEKLRVEDGIDVREDLLMGFGSRLQTVNLAPSGVGTLEPSDVTPSMIQLQSVFLLSLKDAETFQSTLEALYQLAATEDSLWLEEDYLGYRILTLNAAILPPGSAAVAYTVTDDEFLFSVTGTEALRKVLAVKYRGSEDFFASDELSNLWELLPPGAIGLEYGNMDTLLDAVLQISRAGITLEQAQMGPDAENPEAIEAIPASLDFPYHYMTGSYFDGKQLLLKGHLRPIP